jgi:hypothetical protein
MTERQLQTCVEQVLRLGQWRFMHIWNSKRSSGPANVLSPRPPGGTPVLCQITWKGAPVRSTLVGSLLAETRGS